MIGKVLLCGKAVVHRKGGGASERRWCIGKAVLHRKGGGASERRWCIGKKVPEERRATRHKLSVILFP
jgi:hypothetical protein